MTQTFHQLIKPGDCRGPYPQSIHPEFAYLFAKALAFHFFPQCVSIGHDMRASSPILVESLSQGFLESGVHVHALGMMPTEVSTHWSVHHHVDLSLMVTASHNPISDNGIKTMLKGAVPFAHPQDLAAVKDLMDRQPWKTDNKPSGVQLGTMLQKHGSKTFVSSWSSKFEAQSYQGMKVFCHGNDGVASLVSRPLLDHLGVNNTWIHEHPNSNFHPNGPNPLLEHVQQDMKQHMDGQNYQFGIAWDGDADRCCFFDEHGDSIESSYAMALIAEVYLRKKSGQTVVHDSKNSWLISHLATTHGCQAVRSKTGHAHIKKTMHDNKAIYGGESSAHHYFQEMDYADSGVMPWLIMLNLFHEGNFSLQKKVDVMRTTFPILKEINLQCHHLEDMLTHIREYYSNRHVEEETFDGHHFIFKEEGWKFHIRNSNTEPLVRLNIEGKTSKELLLKEAKVLTSLFKDA